MLDLAFDCPRCHQPVAEPFYGPCQTCRGELRAIARGARPGAVTTEDYVPKINVTPNAVATKD